MWLTLVLALTLASPGLRPELVSPSLRSEQPEAPRGPRVIEDLSLPPLPGWTDRYLDLQPLDYRFFNISAVMKRFDFSRFQAVEFQNHYRDLARRYGALSIEARFIEALIRVQRGVYESGLTPKALAEASFMVVFDLDSTLYDQREAHAGCYDITYEHEGVRRYVALTPGWRAAFERIKALGGVVIFFSANTDEETQRNVSYWTAGGLPLLDSGLVEGLLTNSHLIRQSKREGRGARDPHKGKAIAEPSKDLRIFDESLKRVILVDDNPVRTFQQGNVRLFRNFHAPAYCEAKDPKLKALAAGELSAVVDEIEDAVAYADAHKISFAEAYRPYTQTGQTAVRAVRAALKLNGAEAVAYLRAHPELIDRKL